MIQQFISSSHVRKWIGCITLADSNTVQLSKDMVVYGKVDRMLREFIQKRSPKKFIIGWGPNPLYIILPLSTGLLCNVIIANLNAFK